MYRSFAASLCLLLGCTLIPTVLGPPENAELVSGGISDTRPFFGTLRTAWGAPAGDFLIATCGCGDWRALITRSDESPQRQFPVRFYSDGPYVETGFVQIFGQDEADALAGRVDQVAVTADGHLLMSQRLYRFESLRTETHTDDATACVKCHVGSEPTFRNPQAIRRSRLTPRIV